MTNPYTYYLFHKPTSQKYYGVRWANICSPEDDLWKIYFSSSKAVKRLIDEYGKDSFISEVRRIFNSVDEALYWEDRVLQKLKARDKPDWLNQSTLAGPFYRKGFGENSANFGTRWSNEQRANRSAYLKTWWKINGDSKRGVNSPNYGRKNPEQSIRMKSNAHNRRWCGKPWSNERKRLRWKAVQTPLGVFESVTAASVAHNVSLSTIVQRCKNNEAYQYLK